MPIEIKELHIKAIVGVKEKQTPVAVIKTEEIAKLKKEIIREVTDRIFRTLRQKNER